MKCTVYRSSNKDFTYIYLKDGCSFEDLPASLQKIFGDPSEVMALELTPERKLSYEDVNQVIKNLSDEGFHLQLPPKQDPSGLLDLRAEPGRLF